MSYMSTTIHSFSSRRLYASLVLLQCLSTKMRLAKTTEGMKLHSLYCYVYATFCLNLWITWHAKEECLARAQHTESPCIVLWLSQQSYSELEWRDNFQGLPGLQRVPPPSVTELLFRQLYRVIRDFKRFRQLISRFLQNRNEVFPPAGYIKLHDVQLNLAQYLTQV
jgi:hypothetical protein